MPRHHAEKVNRNGDALVLGCPRTGQCKVHGAEKSSNRRSVAATLRDGERGRAGEPGGDQDGGRARATRRSGCSAPTRWAATERAPAGLPRDDPSWHASAVRRPLPDHLPIMAGRMRRGDYRPVYEEHELTAAADLCDAGGRLDPVSIGWSRRPLVRANLRGHWPRKKRWNFWNWIGPRFVFSVTLADVDYAAFCQATLIDFETRRTVGTMALARPGSFAMPEHVERTIAFRGRGVEYVNAHEGDVMRVAFSGAAEGGVPIVADFVVHVPPAQESLNVVVPWTPQRFQLNSKHAALPCEGGVRVGDARYAMEPDACHGVQDFGRGVWPYRSFWNWGVATGVHDGVRIAVNVGARWTTGTGVNENGILVGGRLHKVMEDLRWEYDPADWMRPWRVRAERSRTLDLTLDPIVTHRVRTSLGVLATGGVCCFGRWRGTVRVDGQEVRVRDLVGWAEEFAHRW